MTRILRKREVVDRLGIPKTTLHGLVKEGKFPAPLKLAKRIVGWREADIDAWVADLDSAVPQSGQASSSGRVDSLQRELEKVNALIDAAKKEASTGGRPSKYEPHFAELAVLFKRQGKSDVEISRLFGVSDRTLLRWKHENAEFAAVMQACKVANAPEGVSVLGELRRIAACQERMAASMERIEAQLNRVSLER